jgi:Mlo family
MCCVPPAMLAACLTQWSESAVALGPRLDGWLRVLPQIHLLLFLIAVVHIATCVVMIFIATWRVRIWGGWAKQDDEHARA